MKPIVLDTNILLDIFVFNDERAAHLKHRILNREIQVIASQATLEEFADVISRSTFALELNQQAMILAQCKQVATIIEDNQLLRAPWKCSDPDDQIFLDIVYSQRPAILLSKDNALLCLAKKALEHDIVITNDFQAISI